LAPRQQLLAQQDVLFANRRLGEPLARHVREEVFHGIRDVGDIALDHADLTRGFPAAHAILRGLPGHEIKAAPQVLAADRALDPQRALAFLAPRVAAGFPEMFTGVEMATINRERHSPSYPKVGTL
jgi:hypothetical protein